jgi:hypothetical protein
MKFTTITYDANLPTVQQVNVPTNSDYKVGMKVKRNGSVQSIKPSEFTVYTGEVTPGEPETKTISAEYEAHYHAPGDEAFTVVDLTGGSAYTTIGSTLYPQPQSATLTVDGQTIDLNPDYIHYDIFIDFDITWTNDQVDGKMKWKNVVTEEIRDVLTLEEAYDMNIYINKQDLSACGVTSAIEQSCADNGYTASIAIVTKEGGDAPVTYPVDPEKTNGYVTITKASGDNASFKQYGVHIAKGYDFDDYVKQTGFMTDSTSKNFPTTTTAESLGIGGYTLTMENVKWGNKKSKAGAVDVADITYWQLAKEYEGSGWPMFKWANGTAAVWFGWGGE